MGEDAVSFCRSELQVCCALRVRLYSYPLPARVGWDTRAGIPMENIAVKVQDFLMRLPRRWSKNRTPVEDRISQIPGR